MKDSGKDWPLIVREKHPATVQQVLSVAHRERFVLFGFPSHIDALLSVPDHDTLLQQFTWFHG